MMFFGYEKDSDRLLKLEEVSLQCNLDELEEVINFLKTVKIEHPSVMDKTDMCHSHFRDWKVGWNNCDPDFIIVSQFNKNSDAT